MIDLEFYVQGLSSTAIKGFNFIPGSFINNFQKLHHVSLPSFTLNRLVLGESFGRRDQLHLLPGRWPNLQKQRFSKYPCLEPYNSYWDILFG